jgi:hypothetical protein
MSCRERELTERAERAEAERDVAREVARTAMEFLSDNQLVQMRRKLDGQAESDDDADAAGEAATG